MISLHLQDGLPVTQVNEWPVLHSGSMCASPLQVSESLHLSVSVLLALCESALLLRLHLRSLLRRQTRDHSQSLRQVLVLLPRAQLSLSGRFLQQLHTSSEMRAYTLHQMILLQL